MAFSVSPSVIVREVDASQAVPAIASSPAAMAGIFEWGPVNEPILIKSENELVARFGKPNDDNFETFFTAADYLAYANALYVVRADDTTSKANATVLDITYNSNNDIVADNSLYGAFEALHPGTLGENISVTWVIGDYFSSDWIANGDITATAISNTSVDQTIEFNANTVSFELGANTEVHLTVPDIAIGDTLTIGNYSVGYQDLKISSIDVTDVTETTGTGNTAVTTTIAHNYTIGFTTRYTLAETSLNNLNMSVKWSQAYNFVKPPTTVNPSNLNNTELTGTGNLHIAVVDRTGAITGTAGTIIEKYDNVSNDPTATLPQGISNYYVNMINSYSAWISVANTDVIDSAMYQQNFRQTEDFSTGDTGVGEATKESEATLSKLAAAWDTLKSGNEIDISAIILGKADQNAVRHNYVLSNLIEDRKDCVLYASPPSESCVVPSSAFGKIDSMISYRDKVQNSSYAFMDSGYKYRYDKYNDVYRWTPLNGDMAGLAARVQPWESPAGFRKGVIKNVVKLALNPNKAQRDQLYSADINPVMSQVGHGIVLFGDKTMLGLPSAFDRLNVRRLFISLEKSIATAAENFLFEFNDDFTQTQFRNIVEPFLRDIQGRRGIIDFRVVSDSTVNTPEIIDQNMFRANIYIKPARSINTIELTFVATRTGIEFDEIVGQVA